MNHVLMTLDTKIAQQEKQIEQLIKENCVLEVARQQAQQDIQYLIDKHEKEIAAVNASRLRLWNKVKDAHTFWVALKTHSSTVRVGLQGKKIQDPLITLTNYVVAKSNWGNRQNPLDHLEYCANNTPENM